MKIFTPLFNRLHFGFFLFFFIACNSVGNPLPTMIPTAAVSLYQPTYTTIIIPPTNTTNPNHTPTYTPTNTNTPFPTNTYTPIPSQTASPTITSTPTNTPFPYSTSTPRPTLLPPPPQKPPPSVNASPGNPQPYLSRYRLVTYYGSPLGPGLGILGNQARNNTLRMLRSLSAEYQALSSTHVMPTYHMVTTVANSSPPIYSHHVGLGTLEDWVNHANANQAAVILDIQPGYADISEEINRVKYLLYNPHVHLAIDPEFVMLEGQVPGIQVGRMFASQINEVQEVLNQVALEMGVKRVLILHQFKGSMLPDKELITDYPYVELVIDSDGAFNSAVKVYNYNLYANEGGFDFGGIKIFYNHDDRILPAWEVMNLNPTPAIIIYQ